MKKLDKVFLRLSVFLAFNFSLAAKVKWMDRWMDEHCDIATYGVVVLYFCLRKTRVGESARVLSPQVRIERDLQLDTYVLWDIEQERGNEINEKGKWTRRKDKLLLVWVNNGGVMAVIFLVKTSHSRINANGMLEKNA